MKMALETDVSISAARERWSPVEANVISSHCRSASSRETPARRVPDSLAA